jgi:hypothetical protein
VRAPRRGGRRRLCLSERLCVSFPLDRSVRTTRSAFTMTGEPRTPETASSLSISLSLLLARERERERSFPSKNSVGGEPRRSAGRSRDRKCIAPLPFHGRCVCRRRVRQLPPS